MITSTAEGDIQPASTIQVVADVHRAPAIASTEDDIQPAPTIQVFADVRHTHDTANECGLSDIPPASTVIAELQNAVNIRRLIKACSPTSVSSSANKPRRKINRTKASLHYDRY